jgi:hypothetical protein
MTPTPHTRCSVCGRDLWTPETIRAGIGPKCAAKIAPPKPKRLRKVKPSHAAEQGVPLFPEEGGEV